MANTIMPTVFSSGVRRMHTLSGWPMLGAMGTPPDQTTIAELVVNGGYDMGTINTLITMGASNEQLQALPYPASANERAAGITNLMNQLGGAQAAPGAPATSAGSYPQSAVPTTISTAFGVYDLTQQASWDAINAVFSNVQQQLNELGRMLPKDPVVIGKIQDFNALVGQWTGYYQQTFGTSPSPIPFASYSTLGGLGIAPLAIAGIAVAVAALLASIYPIYQWASGYKTQALANLQAQQNQAALSKALADAQAKGDTATANKILSTMAITGGTAPQPPGATNWSAWLQQNMGLLIFGLAAMVIVPPLLRKR